MSGYDPQFSRLAEDTLGDFLRAPLTGDLTEVPGIGINACRKLINHNINNTFQLIGKFLSLKSNSDDTDDGLITCVEHCDAFWHYLNSIDIRAYKSGIVMAISEKVNTMLPGIYDAAEFSSY